MRKRHQALLVSSQAKKKICNELSINNSSYEVEQKQILNNYFNNHIDEEDIEVTSASKKADDKNLIKEKENIEEEDEENELDDKDDDDEEEENVTLSTDIRVPPLGDQKGPYIKYEISEKAYVGGVNFDDYSYIPENKLKIKENIDDNDKKKAKTNKKNVKDKNLYTDNSLVKTLLNDQENIISLIIIFFFFIFYIFFISFSLFFIVVINIFFYF